MAADGPSNNLTFPSADVDSALNPGKNKNAQVDPVSSSIAAGDSVHHQTNLFPDTNQEGAKAAKKKQEREGKDTMQTLKTTILVSALIVAVAGAAFAITKKLKEK